jgi:hypothetical protein
MSARKQQETIRVLAAVSATTEEVLLPFQAKGTACKLFARVTGSIASHGTLTFGVYEDPGTGVYSQIPEKTWKAANGAAIAIAGLGYDSYEIPITGFSLVPGHNYKFVVTASATGYSLEVIAVVFDGENSGFDLNAHVDIEYENKPGVYGQSNNAAPNSYTTPNTGAIAVDSVTVHFSAAPTTSENLTVTLDAALGAAYDTVLLSTNPSLTAATSVVWKPDGQLLLGAGDVIVVAFPNTDTRTVSIRVTYRAE